ncbi:hypothetical protein DEDE109153_16965 [Deinococcus deserti]
MVRFMETAQSEVRISLIPALLGEGVQFVGEVQAAADDVITLGLE